MADRDQRLAGLISKLMALLVIARRVALAGATVGIRGTRPRPERSVRLPVLFQKTQ
jgi:hypothetical protein